ncbi:MAG: type II toxin-antitoxin system HicB family antitoxin [Thermosynechococcaceae cyanobacterium]
MGTAPKRTYNYMVIFEKEADGGYHASCPALKGCHSQGDSFEEASANISEAIALYIESLQADRERVPENSLIVQQVCVSV